MDNVHDFLKWIVLIYMYLRQITFQRNCSLSPINEQANMVNSNRSVTLLIAYDGSSYDSGT